MKKIRLILFITALLCCISAFGCGTDTDETEQTATDSTFVEAETETEAETSHIHDYEENTVSQTCDSNGYKTFFCADCGESYTEEITSTGHSITVHIEKKPTCTEVGYETYESCDLCGYTTYRELPINPDNHVNYELVSIDGKTGTFKCSDCGKTFEETLTYENLGAPIVEITGSLKGISKSNQVSVEIKYDGYTKFTSTALMDVQGATSASFEKKNYNIRFTDGDEKQKVILSPEWGARSKYCLKANYVDASHARNIVSCRLYGQIVASRNADDNYSKLINGGAIDGFPIAVYINGKFNGLYTLNLPKDNQTFEMDGDSGEKQAILKAASWNESVFLNEAVKKDFSNGWQLVYCSTEDTSWVSNSFNQIITAVNKFSGDKFKRIIERYVNVDRAIDTFILVVVAHADDNYAKNIIWTTYDGKIWSPSVYDMDDSWGLVWNGEEYYDANDSFFTTYTHNQLWNKLYTEYHDEIIARYKELRETVLSEENIVSEFQKFENTVPEALKNYDKTTWPQIPSRKTNNMHQIKNFVHNRLKYLDKKCS